jgi:hypothetical protein
MNPLLQGSELGLGTNANEMRIRTVVCRAKRNFYDKNFFLVYSATEKENDDNNNE